MASHKHRPLLLHKVQPLPLFSTLPQALAKFSHVWLFLERSNSGVEISEDNYGLRKQAISLDTVKGTNQKITPQSFFRILASLK